MATKEKKPRKATPLPPPDSSGGEQAAPGGSPAGEASAPGELPIGEGPGVSHVTIPALVKAINRYEGVKDDRVAASAKEVAAKTELFVVLHKHRDELPVNGEGFHFYQHDSGDGPVNYVLEEQLKRRAAGDDQEG